MNPTRIKELIDEVDLILEEASDVPTRNTNEAVARIADMGKLEAVKEVLKSLIRPASETP